MYTSSDDPINGIAEFFAWLIIGVFFAAIAGAWALALNLGFFRTLLLAGIVIGLVLGWQAISPYLANLWEGAGDFIQSLATERRGHSGLTVNGQATITTTGGDLLRLREGAGLNFHTYAREYWLSKGALVTLIEGPRVGEGYWWWKVRTVSGKEGWVVEWADGVQTLIPVVVQQPVFSQTYYVKSDEANVRSCASKDCPEFTVLLRGSQVHIIGWEEQGQEVNGNKRWAQVNYNGQTAYIHSPLLTTVPPDNPVVAIEVTPFDLGDGYELQIQFNRNSDPPLIVNGAEIVVNEIQRFQSKVITESEITQLPQLIVRYFSLDDGNVENLRIRLTETLCDSGRSCSQPPQYKIGNRYMDMSGLGNVVYGYFMWVLPTRIPENIIANIDQDWRNAKQIWGECGHSLGCFLGRWQPLGDEEDDKIQRNVGRELAKAVISGQQITSELLETIAEIEQLR